MIDVTGKSNFAFLVLVFVGREPTGGKQRR